MRQVVCRPGLQLNSGVKRPSDIQIWSEKVTWFG